MNKSLVKNEKWEEFFIFFKSANLQLSLLYLNFIFTYKFQEKSAYSDIPEANIKITILLLHRLAKDTVCSIFIFSLLLIM